MQRNAANRFTSRIMLGAASVAASAAACASNIVGMAPTSRSPQIMIYVSQALWSPGTSLRVYGFRIEEVRALPSWPQSAAASSFRRSELFDLQVVPHSVNRIEIGRRLVWNFTHEAFGPESAASSVAIGFTIHSIRSPGPARLQPWDLRASSLSLMAGRHVPDPQVRGLSVKLATALVTIQWTASDGRPVTAVNGLATPSSLSRVCSFWTCPVSAVGFLSSSFDH